MDSRVWLITGASSGFGHALATAALARGDTVVGAARRTNALPAGAEAAELDVTDPAACRAAVDAVVERHGRLDVLVNVAGRALIGAAEETTDAELRSLMDVHFFGPVALTRAALPHLRRQQSGAIVQFSSLGGRTSFAGVSAYSATKFALEGYSEALAAEVGPLGIRVLIVEPGAFRTGLHGESMWMTERNPAYDDIVEPIRKMQRDFDGAQPGDPAKAAAAILDALAADEPPLRLVLGNDSADAIAGSMRANQAEFEAWEHVARSTDLDAMDAGPDRMA
jgi:NAD(P)-dependent dehydrogenase (short-subunit alcohol dehydrogenase family)